MEIWLSTASDESLPATREHQPVEFLHDNPAVMPLVLSVDGLALDAYLRPGETVWRWRWNPAAAVGLHTVVLHSGDQARRVWPLQVAPRKIDQERYELLIDDIQRVAHTLAYELGGASAEGAALDRTAAFDQQLFARYYALIEAQLDPFARAVRRIAARPREQLAPQNEQIPLGQASGLDATALAQIGHGSFDAAPHHVAHALQTALRPEGGLLPRTVSAPQSQVSYDLYEHRLLKHLLGLLVRRVRLISDLAQHEARRLARADTRDAGGRGARVQQIGAGCAQAEATLRDLRALPFLADVHPLPAFRGATPLLQRDSAYREVYRMWQALRQQPELLFDSPLFAIPITELPYLYETWCVLRVASAVLLLDGEVREQRLVTVPPDDGAATLHSISLNNDGPLLTVALGPTTLVLRYQPRYRPQRSGGPGTTLVSLDRHTRVPDMALEIYRPDVLPQVLLFDAKYRLDDDGRGVPADALADAYAYLGAIGAGSKRATVGALLLYPGQADERYSSGVGALALLPGRADQLVAAIISTLVE